MNKSDQVRAALPALAHLSGAAIARQLGVSPSLVSVLRRRAQGVPVPRSQRPDFCSACRYRRARPDRRTCAACAAYSARWKVEHREQARRHTRECYHRRRQAARPASE